MTWVLLVVLLIITNVPYKRTYFPEGSWKETRVITIMFILASGVLGIMLTGTAIPIRLSAPLIVLFIGTTILWFLTPMLVRKYGIYPDTLLKKSPKRFLVRLAFPVWTLKYFEVLFQQVTFLYLLFFLLQATTNQHAIWWFVIIVSTMHLVNFAFREAKMAALFFLLSIPMSILFSYLLIHGYVLLTLTIHLFFYILFYGSYWLK